MKRIYFAAFFALLFIVAFAIGCASTGQPHMAAARDQLIAARSDLVAATSDKGGHRAQAIKLVDDAIAEVDLGMEFARTH
jgi:hypothetical protein